MSQQTGFAVEQKVRDYLIKQGLGWLASNYRCYWGEIDLIMQEQDYLVFVEVKARASAVYGGALASITYAKQRKILKTAAHYLTSKKLYAKQPVRFDVIGVQGSNAQIEWIRNAFGNNL